MHVALRLDKVKAISCKQSYGIYLLLIIGTNAVISRLRYRETLKVTVSLEIKAIFTFPPTSPHTPSRMRPSRFSDNLPYPSYELLLAPTTPTLSGHSPFLPSWAGFYGFPSGAQHCCYTVMSCLHKQRMTKPLPTSPIYYHTYFFSSSWSWTSYANVLARYVEL